MEKRSGEQRTSWGMCTSETHVDPGMLTSLPAYLIFNTPCDRDERQHFQSSSSSILFICGGSIELGKMFTEDGERCFVFAGGGLAPLVRKPEWKPVKKKKKKKKKIEKKKHFVHDAAYFHAAENVSTHLPLFSQYPLGLFTEMPATSSQDPTNVAIDRDATMMTF